jgi:hypothetical protein
MLKKTRCDGTLIEGLPPFTILMPYVMPLRTNSVIFYEQELDVTDTLAYIKTLNRELIKRREVLTLFELVICAAVRTVALRPKVNRFISGKRFYQRNQIVFNFVAKKELSDEGEEVNVKIPFEPEDSLVTVAEKVRRYLRVAVSDEGMANDDVVKTLVKFPHFVMNMVARGLEWLDAHNMMPSDMIESDPCFCSVFLTNVGSFGLDTPFHHLYERGNCPIFVAVGKVRVRNVLDADGSVTERKYLCLRYSFDDRVADGTYMGRSLEMMRGFVEKPEALATPLALDPAVRARLKLRPPAELPAPAQ